MALEAVTDSAKEHHTDLRGGQGNSSAQEKPGTRKHPHGITAAIQPP